MCVRACVCFPVYLCVCIYEPFHLVMAPPPVADGGEGLQMWRVAANVVNKQSRIHLAQHSVQWRVLVNTVMKLRVL
jgi:hypothetical protein